MSKLKIIALLIIITIVAEFGAYLVNQHIEDNKKLAPDINDTPEINRYYSWILLPFQIPLLVTILYLIYQVLVVVGVINEK